MVETGLCGLGNTVQMCRDVIRKAKALTEIILVRDAKDNKKGFFRYFSCKRKTKESILPLTNKDRKLITEDVEKSEVLNKYFASVFTGGQASHILSRPQNSRQGLGERSPSHCK